MFKVFIPILSFGFIFSQSAFAMIGACGSRPLPEDKTRQARNIHLECSSNASHYIRRPQPYDFNAWRDTLKKSDGPVKAQQLRQQQSLIQWEGIIPYSTIETWTWTDWVYGADPVCGYDTVCTSSTDEKGNTTQTCHDEMRSCWHDEDRYESRHCSNEKLRFTAEYERPHIKDWNTQTPGYYDVIPNKYDLLPGEMEDAQVFTNNSVSSSLSPKVDIGNAWNKYSYIVEFVDGGSSRKCTMNANHTITAKIITLQRDNTKKTPNAFGPPVDHHGRTKDFLATGQRDDDGHVVQKPSKIRLSDSSSQLISTMAKQSRKQSVAIHEAQEKIGMGSNTEDASAEEKKKEHDGLESMGFYKNTQIRIRLIKITGFLQRDIISSKPLILPGTSVQTTVDSYSVFLAGSDDTSNLYQGIGPYINWSFLSSNLEPNQKYKIGVAMYQEGVPFYLQDCNSQYRFSDCGIHTKISDLAKRDYFSKELEIEFKTGRTLPDERSLFQKVNNWLTKSPVEKIKGVFGL